MTGVQTCALPICLTETQAGRPATPPRRTQPTTFYRDLLKSTPGPWVGSGVFSDSLQVFRESFEDDSVYRCFFFFRSFHFPLHSLCFTCVLGVLFSTGLEDFIFLPFCLTQYPIPLRSIECSVFLSPNEQFYLKVAL